MKGRLKDLTFGAKGEQHITITVTRDFRAEFDKLKDFDISVEIKKYREPRSKDANAYFHLLVNKIADVTGDSDDEAKVRLVLQYGTLAKDAGGQVLGAMLPPTAKIENYYPYAKWYKSMTVNDKEYDCYLFYKRTHEMDSKEMSRLIDGTVFEAQRLGIDTDTPEMKARYDQLQAERSSL